MSLRPTVFLCMPRAGAEVLFGASYAFWHPGEKARVINCSPQSSILPYTFNDAWAAMLNRRAELGLTHVAMIHDDVSPEAGWLDTMLAELERCGGDFLSAVIPIKTKQGLTSTAIDNERDPWNVRRLTLTEVWKRPETFTEPGLLVNTGLWVAKIDSWCERVWFRQNDRIIKRDDGVWCPMTISEDWDFSRQVKSEGVKIAATRIVPVVHESPAFHTKGPWGEWETDMAFEEYMRHTTKKVPQPALEEAAI